MSFGFSDKKSSFGKTDVQQEWHLEHLLIFEPTVVDFRSIRLFKCVYRDTDTQNQMARSNGAILDFRETHSSSGVCFSYPLSKWDAESFPATKGSCLRLMKSAQRIEDLHGVSMYLPLLQQKTARFQGKLSTCIFSAKEYSYRKPKSSHDLPSFYTIASVWWYCYKHPDR